MDDDRDAWLDDVRRWFYGGTPPAEPESPARGASSPVPMPAPKPRPEFPN